jgi:hypothetical protein
MSWETDGSAELDAAVKAVGRCSNEEIAERLKRWARDGVNIGWVDFVEREYLDEAARRLMAAEGARHE